MDDSNYHNLKYIAPKGNHHAVVKMLGHFDPDKVKDEATTVEDPYYDSDLDRFEFNFHLISRCCDALLDHVHQNDE